MKDEIQIHVIRSRRKTISIQVCRDLSVLIRIPYYLSERQLKIFLTEKSDWIKKHVILEREKQKRATKIEKLDDVELRELLEEAAEYIPSRVAYYAELIPVTYGRITIRGQKTRWGSCSSNGNLNFNCLLMLVPRDVLDYVVVHELCHRREMNHSKDFWNLVESVMPDYKEKRTWLKEHGEELIARL